MVFSRVFESPPNILLDAYYTHNWISLIEILNFSFIIFHLSLYSFFYIVLCPRHSHFSSSIFFISSPNLSSFLDNSFRASIDLSPIIRLLALFSCYLDGVWCSFWGASFLTSSNNNFTYCSSVNITTLMQLWKTFSITTSFFGRFGIGHNYDVVWRRF